MFGRIVYFVVWIYVHLICRPQVKGHEHIPSEGSFLMIVNHLSAVDPPLVFSLIPPRLKLTGLAAMAHRNDFFIGWVLDLYGVIWVRRGQSDRQALRQSLKMLAEGRPVGLAPEGTRSKTGALIEGKSGTAFLALKADVPILPVTLVRTEQVWPNLRRLRRIAVPVTIAPAFYLPEQKDGPRAEYFEYCTDLIMTRLASLLPVAYRGVYQGHPLISYWEHLDTIGAADRPEWKRQFA